MSTIPESILASTKKVLGLPAENTDFDMDVIMHINSVLSMLHQMGIGPTTGFAIEDATPTWTDFLTDVKPLNDVKSYVYLRVRMMFDPPGTSFHLAAMEKQIDELGWRINVYQEGVNHPLVTVPPDVSDYEDPLAGF